MATVHANLAFAGSSVFWLPCVVVSNDAMKDYNFMQSAYTVTGQVKTSHDGPGQNQPP